MDFRKVIYKERMIKSSVLKRHGHKGFVRVDRLSGPYERFYV